MSWTLNLSLFLAFSNSSLSFYITISAASSVATVALMLRNRTIVISKIVTRMNIINRYILTIIRTIIRNIVAVTMGVISLLPNCWAVVTLYTLRILRINLSLSWIGAITFQTTVLLLVNWVVYNNVLLFLFMFSHRLWSVLFVRVFLGPFLVFRLLLGVVFFV